jgi:type II secretory pathway pseudopilin PulG
LIELLVVITIIGMLAAVLIPAIAGALRSAKRSRAFSQIQDLDGAIKRFMAEYGKPPLPRGTSIGDADVELNTTGQSDILLILLNQDDWAADKRNTKQMVFLDLDPASFGVKSVVEMLAALQGGPYRDPWGNPYGIFLDVNLDDRIEVPPFTGADFMRAKVGVYSLGEPEKGFTVQTTPYKTW